MKIHIIGTGYVGLVTALSFCHHKHEVKCWDIDQETIEKLSSGHVHFFEPDCESLLVKALSQKKISFSHISNFKLDFDDELIFICVGTPTINNNIDLRYIKQSVTTIAKHLTVSINPSIIIKSTVIPGTTADTVSDIVRKTRKNKNVEVNLGMAPEFLREGSAIQDCLYPDRVVIGSNNELTKQRLDRVYEPFRTKIVHTSLSTAEFSKYANNSILALLISMSNELANIAHLRSDINIDEAIEIVGLDKRWRASGSLPSIFNYLYPGCGFGGSCFPKDVKALESYANEQEQEAPMLSSILTTNDQQPKKCLEVINDWTNKVNKIGILGLSFKPNTNDIRESPAIPIIDILSKSHKILINDPEVTLSNIEPNLENSNNVYYLELEDLLSDATLLILVTPWSYYLDIHKYQGKFPNKMIYDCRSVLHEDNFTNWQYRSYSNKELF